MSGVNTRPPTVIGPQLAGTAYGQTATHQASVPDHVRNDLRLTSSAIREWNSLRRGIRNEIKTADPATSARPRLGLKLAKRNNVGGLRGAIDRVGYSVGQRFETRRMLRTGRIPQNNENAARLEVEQDLPRFRKKLALLCQFDRLAGQMRGTGLFGTSKADKVATTVSGLSGQAFDNVNVGLKDDILLASENRLLSVSKHFPADGFGKVKSARSRHLIRQMTAATLLQHGYAAAKLIKQDLTNYCELAERSGTDSAFASHVRNRMAHAVARINQGDMAADVHAETFAEINGRTEQANLQRISKSDLGNLLDTGRNDGLTGGQRNLVRQALLMTAAKGTLKAAQQFRAELADKPANQQMILANRKLQALSQARPHQPHTYYNPFRGGEDDLDMSIATSRAKYAAKPHYTVRDSSWFGSPLKNVDDNHVVLIDGHGNDRLNLIAAQSSLRDVSPSERARISLSAEQLAERLEKDGLPKTHKTIRLLACYGGGSTLSGRDGNFGPSIQHNQQDNAYAQRLATALKARGYNDITVGGYPGSVHVRGMEDKKAVTASSNGSARLIDASGLCLYYNGDGQQVPNPRNPAKRLNDNQLNQLLGQRLQD